MGTFQLLCLPFSLSCLMVIIISAGAISDDSLLSSVAEAQLFRTVDSIFEGAQVNDDGMSCENQKDGKGLEPGSRLRK